MQCEKCGGTLTLEDVVCPYCEEVNKHAIQHIREMKRYKKAFEGTQADVYSTTKKYTRTVIKIGVIAVLLVVTVICGIASGKAYSIRRMWKTSQSVRNADERKAVMEQYLEERDYYSLSLYADEYYIDTYEGTFQEYDSVIRMANCYYYIHTGILHLMKPYEGADITYDVHNISNSVNDFYKIFNPDYYYYIGDSEKNREIAAEVEEQIKALLIAYVGITGEEADALSGMSDAQRILVIEEKLLHE